MTIKRIALLAASALLPLVAGQAAAKTAFGSYNGLNWQAQSMVVGQTGTGTVASGGDPIYLATAGKYRGTVGLLMDYGAGGAFVCSGSLSANRTAIITAGHCVSDGFGTKGPNSVTAYFYNPGSDPFETPVYTLGAPNVTKVAINHVIVNPLYTGEVIDQNDIAVLKLAGLAPAFATGYDLYLDDDLTGLGFNVAGYGRRSTTGGDNGTTAPFGLGTGRLRQGDNRYDFAFGDADFGGFFTDRDANGENFFGTADIEFSYVSDFDNGRAANDVSCRLAVDGLGIGASGKYCNLGVGAREVGIAGGDSGGPGFVNGKLASVNSYGLSFGPDFGDFGGGLNSGFGEFSGYAPIFASAAFVQGAIPEPATWALMIGGFGLVGGAARRRRAAAVAA